MENFWKNKRVLITGVCGTIGQELLRQLHEAAVSEIVGIDNNETGLFFLKQQYQTSSHITLELGDLRDRDRLISIMRGVDVVLHAAALKHVGLCEQSPSDAIQTNILGTQNVIQAAIHNKVARVLYTSSDKAVNPTNVMGTSKLMGERLITAANNFSDGNTIFLSTRFGNVLGSRGSVIPLFKKQIAQGGPVTLTHPDMTRFIMTLSEATKLVIDSAFLGNAGEVMVTKMPAINIKDLAEIMVRELDPSVQIKLIGSKIGEKMYEELVNEEEVRRTRETDNYFIIEPAFAAQRSNAPSIHSAYNSQKSKKMSREDLRSYLKKNQLLREQEEVTA